MPIDPRALGFREDDLLANVRTVARAHGCLTYHTHDSRKSERGFPDLVIVGVRAVIFRELKTERGRLTQEQTVWLARLGRAGCDAEVWRPSDLLSKRIHNEIRAIA